MFVPNAYIACTYKYNEYKFKLGCTTCTLCLFGLYPTYNMLILNVCIACTSYLSLKIWRGLIAAEINKAYSKMKHQLSNKLLFQQKTSISRKGVCKKMKHKQLTIFCHNHHIRTTYNIPLFSLSSREKERQKETSFRVIKLTMKMVLLLFVDNINPLFANLNFFNLVEQHILGEECSFRWKLQPNEWLFRVFFYILI